MILVRFVFENETDQYQGGTGVWGPTLGGGSPGQIALIHTPPPMRPRACPVYVCTCVYMCVYVCICVYVYVFISSHEHIERVLIHVFSYRMCFHVECVLIHVFSYRMCSHIECVLI